jgi:hypothetical protein
MRVYLKLLITLFFLSCNTSASTLDIDKCGNEYLFTSDEFNINTELTGKIRYVIFLDDCDSTTFNADSATSILNVYLEQTNVQMEISSVDTVRINGLKNRMPSFIEHATTYNQLDVINVYVYAYDQPYFSELEKNIKGRAADIPSRSIAIRDSFIYSSSLAHETLHCFGLFHVHQPDNTGGYSTLAGDLVCDTKSFTTMDELVDSDCNYVGPDIQEPDTDAAYSCNLLSYIQANCRTCLTDGQIKRMRYVIHSSMDLRRVFGYKNVNL